MLKTADLRGLGPEELTEKLSALKKNLMKFRFEAKTGKLERASVIKQTKADIARVLTIMQEQKNTESKA